MALSSTAHVIHRSGWREGRREMWRRREWSGPASPKRRRARARSLIAAVGASLAALVATMGAPTLAEDGLVSLAKQKSLTDTPGGPKDELRRLGIDVNVWVTQFFQGIPAGAIDRTARYGGKMDMFLRLDGEKLGFWKGLKFNAQYEHYFGRNVNRQDLALLPVNVAQAFIERDGYHSALSMTLTQELSEELSVTIGKFNMLTLAAQTPLVGGGGIDTFMNRAFALPSTGIGVSSPESVADRLIIAPPYLLGGVAALKTKYFDLRVMVADPRNAQQARVITRPFERGVGAGLMATVPVEIGGLNGFHTLRFAYSNARGFDLDDIGERRQAIARLRGLTKKGFWFVSYAVQQYFVQSATDPKLGWGLFTLATLSDGNPNPVRWSMLVGLAGYNLMTGREDDRWGVGYYHYGLTQPLLSGLAARRINRRSEGGVEAFYNFAVTRWLRLSGDVQIIDPWNPLRARASYLGLRLQTIF
ncbi:MULTISPECIES: carbohydrate porin [unclassified Methylocystis]|uniref:carbohydrate porin n=1 Tax=unclassified Methylocystis TaxID=2625913 RepID=UPI001FEFD522|nr:MULTISPECIES: carbohydrate porin [unclassified Methylocystis]